jgi:hypothetical protein
MTVKCQLPPLMQAFSDRLNSPKHSDTFTTLYGMEDWKRGLQDFDASSLTTLEAEYYCKRLQEGGVDYTLSYMLERADRSELMYHLVFTSNSDKGLQMMHESMNRCGTKFKLAYSPQSADLDRSQMKLGANGPISEDQEAKDYLMARYGGDELTFEEVVKNAIIDRPKAGSVEKHYRKYLKEMDNGDVLNIPERSNSRDPLKKEYKIIFPE